MSIGRPRSSDYQIGSYHYLARRIVEETLKKQLPLGAVVHHADKNPENYLKNNLVVCPNEAYHNLLHMRTDAYDACGNANWKRCYVCKQYDDQKNLYEVRKPNRRVTTFYHSLCRRLYRKAFAEAKGYKI